MSREAIDDRYEELDFLRKHHNPEVLCLERLLELLKPYISAQTNWIKQDNGYIKTISLKKSL